MYPDDTTVRGGLALISISSGDASCALWSDRGLATRKICTADGRRIADREGKVRRVVFDVLINC